MRARLLALTLLLCLTALPGCLGGGSSLSGPTTIGDRGNTVWQISDGLCGNGLFGADCDLNQHLAVGAAPLVQARGHDGTDLAHATLMAGPNVTLTGFSTSTDDHGTLLQAHAGSEVAGTGDVIVLDAGGIEIDRVHLTWVNVDSLRCGELRSSVTRDLTFAGLTSGVVVDAAMTPDETSHSTTLACRADDAGGNALLTVDAIRWTLATGAVGSIEVHSDDLFGTTPAFGATARVVTTGAGSGTIHAVLGTATDDVSMTFH